MRVTDTAMPANIFSNMRDIRPGPAKHDRQLHRSNCGFQLRSRMLGAISEDSDHRSRASGAMSEDGRRNPAGGIHDPGQRRGFAMMGNPGFQRVTGTIVRLPIDNPTLPLLLMVLGTFRRQAISYCYWKSGKRIQSVLAGEGDLDLLIARRDQHRAQAILLGHGFKLFPSVAMRDHPSILSYLGNDEPSGRLIHLHL